MYKSDYNLKGPDPQNLILPESMLVPEDAPIVYMIVGLPGSGKTTFAKDFSRQAKAAIMSPPDIFKSLCGENVTVQGFDDQATWVLNNTLSWYINKRFPVIIDSVGIRKEHRKDYIETAKAMKARIHCFHIVCDDTELIKRHQAANVPREVSIAYMNVYEPPSMKEGFTNITLHSTSTVKDLGEKFDIKKKLFKHAGK